MEQPQRIEISGNDQEDFIQHSLSPELSLVEH
jgi:hypothetical protein